ncbi:4'-phosphopantetheinyl transferase family protein [Streptomyces drozdowiczii]|uniref:4'-phosphopantetheinyl transferase superfamily protein n=1 Tax=Streptomyces drozdowiczii TaxID=202862 RepID=A0ABY6Q0Z2_9ACTN|nr:4'-phosphopantetheinyl transferase superfamily protein [Streptomyces drozdowiczii]MCX0242115.1 4'-phosphopantetheinyl transferase superfamily protein [Streptomyces drozdowiczii]UZK57796.1 4'-phosphopantetheinyl transferase superfamily protein [Streptomyces drozdowiczii]
MSAPPRVRLRTLSLPAPGEPSPFPVPGCLDAGELARAAGFAGPRARLRYVTAHVALREVLAEYTGTDAARLRFGRDRPGGTGGGPGGRPVLLGFPDGPHFSLSHSHDLIMIAVAALPVGVDVQRVPRTGTVEALLPRLHPAERAGLLRVPRAARAAAFARLWTRKEAYLKGLGTGLARGLAADCLLDGTQPAGWHVRDLAAPPGYAAATAVAYPSAPEAGPLPAIHCPGTA